MESRPTLPPRETLYQRAMKRSQEIKDGLLEEANILPASREERRSVTLVHRIPYYSDTCAFGYEVEGSSPRTIRKVAFNKFMTGVLFLDSVQCHMYEYVWVDSPYVSGWKSCTYSMHMNTEEDLAMVQAAIDDQNAAAPLMDYLFEKYGKGLK